MRARDDSPNELMEEKTRDNIRRRSNDSYTFTCGRTRSPASSIVASTSKRSGRPPYPPQDRSWKHQSQDPQENQWFLYSNLQQHHRTVESVWTVESVYPEQQQKHSQGDTAQGYPGTSTHTNQLELTIILNARMPLRKGSNTRTSNFTLAGRNRRTASSRLTAGSFTISSCDSEKEPGIPPEKEKGPEPDSLETEPGPGQHT